MIWAVVGAVIWAVIWAVVGTIVKTVVGVPDAGTAATVSQCKLMRADTRSLPGLGLKIARGLALVFVYDDRANWMKVKPLRIAVATTSAFVFLDPMMPVPHALAKALRPDAPTIQPVHTLVSNEVMVGASNALPPAPGITLGASPQRRSCERRRTAAA